MLTKKKLAIIVFFIHSISFSFGQSLSKVSTPGYYDPSKIREFINRGESPNTTNQFGNPILAQAVIKNDISLIKFLLSKGADPDQKNSKGFSARHFAKNKSQILKIFNKHEAVKSVSTLAEAASPEYYNPSKIREFINQGENPNSVNSYGNPILSQAVSKNDIQLVKFLLSKGADPNKKNKKGYSAKDFAKGRPKILKLFSQGQRNNRSQGNSSSNPAANKMLEKAISFSSYNAENIKKAISNGAQVNLQDRKSGNSAILMAVIKNNIELARFLMKKNADPNMKNKRGYSAIGMAKMYKVSRSNTKEMMVILNQEISSGGNLNILQYLSRDKFNPDKIKKAIKNGADINTKNKDGETALYLAIGYNKSPSFIEWLLKNKADPMIPATSKTVTYPIHVSIFAAKKNDNRKTIKKLLDYGVDINLGNKERGSSILSLAIVNNLNISFIKWLIQNKANVNRANSEGFYPLNSALDVFIKYKNTEIINLLLDSGANINKMDGIGNYPLHNLLFTIRKNNNKNDHNKVNELIKTFIKFGADVNLRNKYEKGDFPQSIFPISYAIQFNCIQCVETFIKNGAILDEIHDMAKKTNDQIGLYQHAKDLGAKPEILKMLKSPDEIEPKDEEIDDSKEEKSQAMKERIKKRKELLKAAELNNFNKVKLIVENGISPNEKVCCYKETPLYFAAKNGNLKMVNFLLKKGARVNKIENKNYETPLMATALKSDLPEERKNITIALLRKGADYRKTNLSGKKFEELSKDIISNVGALIKKYGHRKFKKEKHAKESPFERKKKIKFQTQNKTANILVKNVCSSSSNLSTIKKILKRGHDPNIKGSYKVIGEKLNALTPLHCLATKKMKDRFLNEKVSALLNNGANPNTSDYYGVSALNWAILKKGHKILEIYTKSGVDLNSPDKNGDFPLALAIKKKNETASKILIKGGANTELIIPEEKMSVKKYALKKGFLKSIFKDPKKWAASSEKVALENIESEEEKKEGSKNIKEIKRELRKDRKAMDLLLTVCGVGVDNRINILKSKIKSKRNLDKPGVMQDPSTMKYFFPTPLHCLIWKRSSMISNNLGKEEQNYKMADLLIKAGADPHAQNYYGKSAFVYAAEKGLVPFLEVFASSGKGLDSFDKDGKNPLTAAIKKGTISSVKSLIMLGANTKIKDPQTSMTPIQLAKKLGNNYAVKYLKMGKDGLFLQEYKKLLPEIKKKKEAQRKALAKEHDIIRQKMKEGENKKENQRSLSAYKKWNKTSINFMTIRKEDVFSSEKEFTKNGFVQSTITLNVKNSNTTTYKGKIINNTNFPFSHHVSFYPDGAKKEFTVETCPEDITVETPPYSESIFSVQKTFSKKAPKNHNLLIRKVDNNCPRSLDKRRSHNDKIKDKLMTSSEKNKKRKEEKQLRKEEKQSKYAKNVKKRNQLCGNLRDHIRGKLERDRQCKKLLIKTKVEYKETWTGGLMSAITAAVSGDKQIACDDAKMYASMKAGKECKKKKMKLASLGFLGKMTDYISRECTNERKVGKMFVSDAQVTVFCEPSQNPNSAQKRKVNAIKSFLNRVVPGYESAVRILAISKGAAAFASMVSFQRLKEMASIGKRMINRIKNLQKSLDSLNSGKATCSSIMKIEDLFEEIQKSYTCSKTIYSDLPRNLQGRINFNMKFREKGF